MKPIQSAFNQFQQRPGFQERYEQLKNTILSDPEISRFLSEQKEISAAAIEGGLTHLDQYRKERANCRRCSGLAQCANMMAGYEPHLFLNHGQIQIEFHKCNFKRADEREKEKQSLITSLYIPKEILEARFADFDRDASSRLAASTAALNFANTAQPGESAHGLYLHGRFGVGKTFIMGAVLNELKERNIQSLIMYFPDFCREIKHSLSDGSFNEKIEQIRKVPVLILDDIGAESMSSWIRDEVLGVILQYRVMEKLPTLYTSNYDYDELEEHLAYSDKNGIEELKAKRLMERIRHFTTPYFLDGRNRRET